METQGVDESQSGSDQVTAWPLSFYAADDGGASCSGASGGPRCAPAWRRLAPPRPPAPCPARPVLGPTAGPPPGLIRWAHGRPPSGVRYRPPAPRRGRSRAAPGWSRGPGSAPPRGGLPAALGGACRCSPLRAPPRRPFGRCGSWAFRRPLLRRGGGASLRSARAAFAPGIPSCFRRCRLGVSPSPPPVPLPLRGRGRRKRLTSRCGGDGRRPAYP